MKKIIIHIIAINALLISCANPVMPTGGPKDETPPQLLETSIPNKSYNIKPEKITFTFDENIQLLSPKENITISPLPKINPIYKKGNKNISIEFPKGSLTDNTTYSINYSNAVSDLNEGNKDEYPLYIFSTGSEIDTLKIEGRLNASSDVTIDKAKIILKQNNNNIYKGIIVKDKFYFDAMNAKSATIIAFIDANNNNDIDSTETFGYYKGDPLNDSIIITLYNVKRKNIETFYTNSNIYIKGLPETLMQYFGKINVSYYKDTMFCDTNIYNKIILESIPATYSISAIKNKRKSSFQYTSTSIQSDEQSLTETKFSFNENIINKINKDSIYVIKKDKTYINISNFKYNRNELIIYTDTGIYGTIHIAAKSIELETNESNNRKIEYEILTTVSHGTVLFENPYPYPVSIELNNNQEKTHVYLNAKETRKIYLKTGNYKGNYFIDENGDHALTQPILNEKQGEKWAQLPDIIANPKVENIIIIQ